MKCKVCGKEIEELQPYFPFGDGDAVECYDCHENNKPRPSDMDDPANREIDSGE